MPDRLKNSGHYSLKFFVTPDEFGNILKLFESKRAKFHITDRDSTEHNSTKVYEEYKKFYDYFTTKEKPNYYPMFVYSISLWLDAPLADHAVVKPGYFPEHVKSFPNDGRSSFFIRDEEIRFPHNRQWAVDKLKYVAIDFQKGLPIYLEDEKGKYYIYEDIREHQPMAYAFYNEITAYIKSITKPFKFFAVSVDSYQEQKPSAVRISSKALNEVSNGWIFKKYQLQTAELHKANNG